MLTKCKKDWQRTSFPPKKKADNLTKQPDKNAAIQNCPSFKVIKK